MLIYYEANSKIIILPKTALLSYMYVFNLDLNTFSNIVIFRHISFLFILIKNVHFCLSFNVVFFHIVIGQTINFWRFMPRTIFLFSLFLLQMMKMNIKQL